MPIQQHLVRSSVQHISARAFSTSNALSKERLVILGSGWAGYKVLSKINKSEYDVSVISPSPHFAFTPLLAGTATGTLEFRCSLEPVRRYASRTHYYHAWADKIDLQRRTITCTTATPKEGDAERDPEKHLEFQVPYDKLVIAVGAYSQTFGIEGVKEHAYFLKSIDNARAIRERIFSCLEKASQPTLSEVERAKLLHWCIVGGGPTGIELAAELHDLAVSDVKREYPSIHHLIKITVFETSDRVLGAFDTNLAKYAESKFAREGIDIKKNHAVLSVGESSIETKQEGTIPAGMIVWSTGLAPNPTIASLEGVKHHEKTQSVLTDDYLRVLRSDGTAMPNVYAIGDAAVIDGGPFMPATAQVADQKATYVTKLLNRQLRDRPTKETFIWKNKGTLAYIGDWSAIMDSSSSDGPKATGRTAWVAWRGAYFLQTLPVHKEQDSRAVLLVHELDIRPQS